MGNYVDDKKFYEEMKKYIESVNKAKKEGTEPPQINNYIGKCILDIATRRSYEKNFYRYPYREGMVMDAVEKCIKYIDNFDPVKYNKPFAYFSQIVWFAFIYRIGEEHKALYSKLKAIKNHEMFDVLSDKQYWDDVPYDESIHMTEYTRENIDNFIENFEKKLDEKKKKQRINASKRKSNKVREDGAE